MYDYTVEQLHEYFLQSPPEVQEILLSDDLDTTSTVLGKLYKLPVDKFLVLKNIITLILLGLIKPENVTEEIQKQISIDEKTTNSLVKDLNDSILQEARMKIFHEEGVEVKKLEIKNSTPSTTDALREEIMSKTKVESAINKAPAEVFTMPTKEKKPVPLIVGSHDQLLDQLNVLETIPKDDEVEDRLSKIRQQVESLQQKTLAEEEVVSKKEEAPVVVPVPHKPIFPEHYNIDPYREEVVSE